MFIVGALTEVLNRIPPRRDRFRAGYGKGKKFWYTYDPKIHRGRELPLREKKLFAQKQIHCGECLLFSLKQSIHTFAEIYPSGSGVRGSQRGPGEGNLPYVNTSNLIPVKALNLKILFDQSVFNSESLCRQPKSYKLSLHLTLCG